MGSFAEEVAANLARPGPRCTFTRIDLDREDRADLDRLLADATVPASAISRALIARGFGIKQQTVTRHRQRECSCP